MNPPLLPLPSGRTVLVTGGARRIGRALCLAFARKNAKVAVHYQGSEAEAEHLVDEIADLGAEASCFRADLRDIDAVRQLAEEVSSTFPGLDLLINNASTWPSPGHGRADRDLERETPGEWDLALAVNARAPFFLIQQLSASLLRNRGSQVVNLMDESVSAPFPDRSSHSVSKAAQWAVTRVAAAQFAGRIAVHGLELGYVLPHDEEAERAKGKSDWIGETRLVEALARVLGDPDRNATEGRWHLQGNGDLIWKPSREAFEPS